MSPEEKSLVLSHTQYVGRHFLAFRGSGDKLVELIRYSAGANAPDAAAISQFLRCESTQKELELNYETALWISNDRVKSWRLISLATTADPEQAARRLSKKAPPDSCSWCWQSDLFLKPELDIQGRAVPGVYLHDPCATPWKLLRDLVARNT